MRNLIAVWIALAAPLLGAFLNAAFPSFSKRRVFGFAGTVIPLGILSLCLDTPTAFGSESLAFSPQAFLISTAMSLGFFVVEWLATQSYTRATSARLAMQSLALLCLFARDLRLLFAAWALIPVAVRYGLPQGISLEKARGFFRYQGVATFLVGLVLLAVSWSGHGFDLATLVAPRADHDDTLVWLGALVCFAAFLRQGLFPFQSGVLAFSEIAPLDLLISLLISQSGLILLSRLGAPLVGEVIAKHHLGLTVLGVVGLVYLSLLATMPKKPRQLVALFAQYDATLVLVGIAAARGPAYVGQGLHWVASIWVVTGLGGSLWLLEKRVGELRTSGLAKSLPELCGLFFAFGLVAVHFPMTLGYVSEEMLIASLFDYSPVLGLGALFGSALLAISLFRLAFRYLYGPASMTFPVGDLKVRERFGLVLVLVAVLFFGAFPQRLVRSMAAKSAGDWTSPQPSNDSDGAEPGSALH